MSPEEIIDAYNVLVDDVNNYTAQEAAKIGNSQRSLGGLAEVVARDPNQTSGLANYTYNRTLRPIVNSSAAALTTTGMGQAMDRYLKDELMKAKNAYEDAKNNYTVAATTPKTTNPNNIYNEPTDTRYEGEQQPYPTAGTMLGTGTTGNGIYDFIIADGKGGYTTHSYYGPSREEALAKYYRDYGGGPASSESTSGSNGNGVSGGGGGGGGGGGR